MNFVAESGRFTHISSKCAVPFGMPPSTILFLESGNVFDSLAEAYMKTGNASLAIENDMRSYHIDLTNENVLTMIKSMVITP